MNSRKCSQSARHTFDVRIVKQEAKGRWGDVLKDLAPGLQPALQNVGKYAPCPVHGGKEGFRVFKNVQETGSGICNTCGIFDDGIALLQWYNEWTLPEAVEAVGNYLKTDRNHRGISLNQH